MKAASPQAIALTLLPTVLPACIGGPQDSVDHSRARHCLRLISTEQHRGNSVWRIVGGMLRAAPERNRYLTAESSVAPASLERPNFDQLATI